MSRGKGGGNKTDEFHTRRTLMYTKFDKNLSNNSFYGHLAKLYAKNVRKSDRVPRQFFILLIKIASREQLFKIRVVEHY